MMDKIAISVAVVVGEFFARLAIMYAAKRTKFARATGMYTKYTSLVLSVLSFSVICFLLALWGAIVVIVRACLAVWPLFFAIAFSIRGIFFNDILGGFLVMANPRIEVGREIESRGVRGLICGVTLRKTYVLLADGRVDEIPNAVIVTQPTVLSPVPSPQREAELSEKAPRAAEPGTEGVDLLSGGVGYEGL